MKSILYVGATLMIGASIYGFVDYKQTSHKKQFKEMYSEKKEVTPELVAEEETEVPVTKKEEIKANGKTELARNTVVKKEGNKKKATKKVVKKKREFSTRLFSRGALDERYIESVKKEETTDNKKTEEKEQ